MRGFEYQLLCTLSYTLDALPAPDFTAVHVEALPAPSGDPEIVDFALVHGVRCTTAAQVKGSTTGRPLVATEALEILLRLVTNEADRYLLITNRPLSSGVRNLTEALVDFTDVHDLRSRLANIVAKSPVASRALATMDDKHLTRLARAAVVVDGRTVVELYEVVRELVREARHGLAPESVGWDAAGLLTGYLMSGLLNHAAADEQVPFTRDDLVRALCVAPTMLASVMRDRDWSVHVNPAPRETDIARPALLDRIAEALPTPVRDDAVPVCVLTGLSGIGKTSTAIAWCNDRADAYAVVIWVEAATTGQLETSFANAAKWFGGQGEQSARDAVFAALAGTARPWLMVFDNASNLRQVHEWLPPRGRGHVLVTTIDPTSVRGPNVASFEVGGMSPAESTDLLARRLLPNRTPAVAERSALDSLAAQLKHWPLALELASAYLADCLGGLAGIDTYRTMMLRALSDQASVPVGYPRPLVQAILLAWQHMRDGPAPADTFASMALRHAAFLAPRQIPLHLALACVAIDETPPAGEIVRSLRRQSLVAVDAPLPDLDDEPEVPGSLAYTVTVNEIVQLILRDEVTREGAAGAVLTTTAAQVQQWIAMSWRTERIALAMLLTGHAMATIEHTEELGVACPEIALLLGNAATVLLHVDHAAVAARYLTTELAMLDQFEKEDPLLRLQVSASLAAAILDSTDRPSAVADEFVQALQGCLRDVDKAREADGPKTAHTLRMALATAHNALTDGMADDRVAAMKSVLEQYCEMIPLAQSFDLVHEMNTLNTLIGDQHHDEALARINHLLTSPDLPVLAHPQLQRLRAECLIGLEHWHDATAVAEEFEKATRQNRIRTIDAAHFARNVGIAALIKIAEAREEAADLLRSAVAVADHHAANGHRMQVQDRAVVNVHRAFVSFLADDKTECQDHLGKVNTDDLQIADRPGFLQSIHHLLQQWTDPHEDADLARHESLVSYAASALTNPKPNLTPDEAVFVFHNGMELLGLRPQLLSVQLTVTPASDRRAPQLSTTHHQVVWIESSSQLVDPTIPFEPLFHHIEEIRAKGVLVMPLRDPDLLTTPHSVTRGRFYLTYDKPGPPTAAPRSDKPLMLAMALLLLASRAVRFG
jgi:hypothetical protein